MLYLPLGPPYQVDLALTQYHESIESGPCHSSSRWLGECMETALVSLIDGVVISDLPALAV